VNRLTFLTWNMALMKRSSQAPPNWSVDQTEASFREQVLNLAPDLVLLQELPRMVPFVETHGMVRANPESHSGNLATLVRHELLATEPTVTTVAGCGILTTFHQMLTVANVHLAPGPGKRAEAERLEQFAEIVESSPTEAIVIVGDTNTRVGEVSTLEAADLHGEQPPSPTWDSRRNRFDEGPNHHEFHAYFTRWFASPGVSVSDVQVLDDPLENDGHRFHLSDHFAMSGSISWDVGGF